MSTRIGRLFGFSALFGLAFLAQAAGPTRAQSTLWYSGDLTTATDINYTPSPYRTYQDFVVPIGQTWDLSSIWSNDVYNLSGTPAITTGTWSISTGVSAPSGGTSIWSGSGTMGQSATGRTSGSHNEYTYTVSNLNIQLAAGTYWLQVTPDPAVTLYQSNTSGTNAVGTTGTSPFYDNGGTFSAHTGSSYSMGVAGTSSPSSPNAVPEPGFIQLGAMLLMGCGLVARRRAGSPRVRNA